MDTYCSPQISELASALIQVQREMAPATKDGNNPFTKSRYATLNSVMDSCREALLAHGIWLTQLPVPAPPELGPGHIGLLTKLTHAESGQWQSAYMVIPLPKADPQGMGSAISYGRRYSLTAMLGMVMEDDDGEGAKLPQQRKTSPSPPKTKKEAKQSNLANDDDLDNLPQLEGITYQTHTAQDGRNYIVATGNTLAKKEILSGAGFRWNAQRKIWWKYSDAS